MTEHNCDKYPCLPPDDEHQPNRRKFLGTMAGIPLAGIAASASAEENILNAQLAAKAGEQADAVSAPSLTFNWTTLKQLKGKAPSAKIGNTQLSRIIMGGNLIGGWAHARDLIYVSKLIKAYHTRLKIFETFRLAEACGVNAIIIHPKMFGVMHDYKKNGGGKNLQFISDCASRDLVTTIKQSIDAGACSCYVQGGVADMMVARQQFDQIAEALELTRKAGLPAGIGGHKIATIQGCVDKGILPDYWMKTLHHHNYWSAKHSTVYDNLWCEKPEQTIEYMNSRPEPWIGFKVLAAGAIHPRQGFKYAFENGADFICVGMYDFQMVEDVNLVIDIFKDGKLPKRNRTWHG